MINFLFHSYIFLLPFQIINIEGITINRLIAMCIVVSFIFNITHKMRIDKKILINGILVISTPLFFIYLEVFRNNFSIGLETFYPFLLNSVLFISVIGFKEKINFYSAIDTIIITSLIVVLLYLSEFKSIGDPYKGIAMGRETVLNLNHNQSALFICIAFVGLMSKFNVDHFSSINKRDIIILILSTLCIWALAKNGTRFGLIILFFYGIYVSYLLFKFNSFFNLILITIAFMTVVFMIFITEQVLILRLMNLFDVLNVDRINLWKFAIESLGENYLLGIGAENFRILSEKTWNSWLSPHNMFLEFYIYGGVLGLTLSIPYLWLIFMPSNLIDKKFNILSLRFGFITINTVIIFFHHILINKTFWIVLIFIYILNQKGMKKNEFFIRN